MTEKETITVLDSIFKGLMSDSYILAKILKGVVDEYKDMDVEDIRQPLPLRDGREVSKGNEEFVNANKKTIRLDNYYEIKDQRMNA